MRTFSRLLRSAVIAVLVLAPASVTAAAAVRGNGNGNATAPGQAKNRPAATPADPAADPATPAPGTPPGQAKKGPAATTAPGQAQTAPASSTPAATAPGQAKKAPAGGTDPVPADGSAAPTPVPAATAPVLGRAMAVEPVTGHVEVRLPGSGAYVPLREAGSVPSGAVVDARRGTLTLRTAIDAAGHVQTARVRGAVFEVRQAPDAHGLTDLVLRGGPPARCGSSVARSAAVSAAGPRAKGGALWASDSHGRFRTRGRNSVATVRGTRWSTRETCAGTVTRVMQGAVDVHDVRTGRTVTVRAGHAYLARSGR